MHVYAMLILAVVILSFVQIIIKYRFTVAHGEIVISYHGLLSFIFQAVRDAYLWLALIMLIIAAVIWYAAISRTSLGVAFAFASLAYPLVMTGSFLFLGETFAIQQILGCMLIVGGLCLIAAYG